MRMKHKHRKRYCVGIVHRPEPPPIDPTADVDARPLWIETGPMKKSRAKWMAECYNACSLNGGKVALWAIVIPFCDSVAGGDLPRRVKNAIRKVEPVA